MPRPDATWTAWGHHPIVLNSADEIDDHEPTREARDALYAVIKASGEFRIEAHPPEGDVTHDG